MTDQATLPDITPAMLKEAGLNSWVQEFMGLIGGKFTAQGYTFEQWREAVAKYCYYSSHNDGGLYVRLRPKFDPEARPCPYCDDPEIVMQPQKDGSWRCPQCKRVTAQRVPGESEAS